MSSVTGFDCSGFTQYVFGKVGISLPRTAEQQRQFVTPVSNPQPGDLVFFGAPACHLGIYAAGSPLRWGLRCIPGSRALCARDCLPPWRVPLAVPRHCGCRRASP